MKYDTQQRTAIETKEKNVLVLAGPGSGKTRVLIARIEELVRRGVDQSKIVVITYTNAAADEIKARLEAKDSVETAGAGDWVRSSPIRPGYCGTLHGWSLEFIRRNASRIGFAGRISILDEETSERFLKEQADKLGFKESLAHVSKVIDSIVNVASCPDRKLRLVASNYYNSMLENGMVDFNGMLYWTIAGLNAGIVEEPVYLLVDEMQDAAMADHVIFNKILATERFYVADPDQCIFGFRGADERHLRTISKLSNFVTLRLENNYRCDSRICDAADNLIRRNRGRLEKSTVSMTGKSGAVDVYHGDNVSNEYSLISSEILARPHATVAVLLRTNALVEQYSAVLGSLGLAIRKRTRPDLPSDWRLAKMVLSVLANPDNDYYAEVIASILHDVPPLEIRKNAAREGQTISELYLGMLTHRSVLDALVVVGLSTESRQLIREASLRVGNDPMAILCWLADAEKEAVDEGSDGVTICTIHAAKGREWDIVFLPAFEQHVIPSERSIVDVEEERRVAFVALTRARNAVFISTARERLRHKFAKELQPSEPSKFIAEAI